MIAIAYLIIGTALIALSVGIVVLGVYLFSDDEGSEGVQTVLKFLYLFFGGFGLAISVAYLLPVSFEIGILLCAGAISLILALKKIGFACRPLRR